MTPDDKLEAAAREYDDSLLQDDNLSESDCTLRDFKAGSAWKEKEMKKTIEAAVIKCIGRFVTRSVGSSENALDLIKKIAKEYVKEL